MPAIDNLVIREWLNGGLLPLNISLVIAIGHSLNRTRIELGSGWQLHPGVASACAFWWIFLADGIRAGLVWITLRTQNRGGSVASIDGLLTHGYMIAATIGVLASLRCIYLATPRKVGHWGWIISALSTLAFVVTSQMLRSPIF